MTQTQHRFRLGVDIGGTFTDAMLVDEGTGETWSRKVPTTPRDPSVGFIDVTELVFRDASVSVEAVSYIVHGTTIATNAIIEGNGAKTGFITTQGFRDILEMQRQMRPSLYDLRFTKPAALIPRNLAFEVPERLDANGAVVVPLDEDAVRATVRALKGEEVEAIAVCFLHGYLNGSHERRTGEIIREELPEVGLSLSSDVAPEIREYFRASTTVINALVQPVVKRYLQSIEGRLRAMGVSAELLVMQSNGGVYTFAAAIEKPVFLIESGPAAGVIAAAHLGSLLGQREVMSFDMGGTTAKTGLIQDSQPKVTKEYEVGVHASADVGGNRGSGYPIKTPVIDLVEIGAGGGSIAWVDSGGVLRVGPKSSGADPGPACYGQGGTKPTITDANLILGRLNPEYFLGGEILLDIEAAREAIEKFCAGPLGLDVTTAANGIVEIANTAMINALRLVSVQRGYDPRDFVLVPFGGAGGVHANRLAAELQIPLTIVPPAPGVFSAFGLLVTDLKHEYSTTRIRRTDQLDVSEISGVFSTMADQGRTLLLREGVADEVMSFPRHLDMRYVGQSWELSIPLPEGTLDQQAIDCAVGQFHNEHKRAYGHSTPGAPTEFVNLRLAAVGIIQKPQMRQVPAATGGEHPVPSARRPVYFSESGGFIDTSVHLRYSLGSGSEICGPAVIEEIDATVVLHPGFRATVDKLGNLLIAPDPTLAHDAGEM